jgi:hypothetical protein
MDARRLAEAIAGLNPGSAQLAQASAIAQGRPDLNRIRDAQSTLMEWEFASSSIRVLDPRQVWTLPGRCSKSCCDGIITGAKLSRGSSETRAPFSIQILKAGRKLCVWW